MKKLAKIIAVAVLMASSVGAITLEDFDRLIAKQKNPAEKQAMLCEREVRFILKDPTVCIKAAQISLKEYDAMPEKGYMSHTELVVAMYSNAGAVYYKTGDYANEVKMYKKTLEFSPNDAYTNYNLGLSYVFGNGIEANKIKAYEHWRIAAKQGHKDAQKNLDILCNESPWACK